MQTRDSRNVQLIIPPVNPPARAESNNRSFRTLVKLDDDDDDDDDGDGGVIWCSTGWRDVLRAWYEEE